jgi:hypothetical protein
MKYTEFELFKMMNQTDMFEEVSSTFSDEAFVMVYQGARCVYVAGFTSCASAEKSLIFVMEYAQKHTANQDDLGEWRVFITERKH